MLSMSQYYFLDLFYEDLNKAAKSKVQSVLIPRKRYTLEAAKKWISAHGFHVGKPPDITRQYYRFRQADPGGFSQLRTKDVGGGIKLIIGWA